MKHLVRLQLFSGFPLSVLISRRDCAWRMVLPVLLLAFPSLMVAPAYAVPRVVVSIAPLHSLMSEVMQGIAEPVLLIEGGQSPHSSRLAPSARREIANADMLVWLGASFETSLNKAFAQVHAPATVVSLLAAATIPKLPIRSSGAWEVEHHHQDAEAEGHASDGESDALTPLKSDPHLWLSTGNAIEIVSLLTAEISNIDPDNAEKYASNKRQVVDRIGELKTKLMLDLKPVHEVPYLVFHDAYHYFENEFGLSPAGALTLNPERKPGAKTISTIKNLIIERNVRCLFSEPQFEPGLLRRLAEDTNIQTGVLDPLGSKFSPGAGQWFSLMYALRDDLLACIAKP